MAFLAPRLYPTSQQYVKVKRKSVHLEKDKQRNNYNSSRSDELGEAWRWMRSSCYSSWGVQEEKFSCNSKTQGGNEIELKERQMNQQNIFAFNLWNEHWTQVPDAMPEKYRKLCVCLYLTRSSKSFVWTFTVKAWSYPYSMCVPRVAYNSREFKKIYRFTEPRNYCKGNLEVSRLEQENQKPSNQKTHPWKHKFCQNACFM